MDKTSNTLPLKGVRVLEFTLAVMGPCAGMMLADMGAEVIKVERTPEGDDTRRMKGFGIGFYPYFNRNKQSIVVNLKSSKGKEIVHRLIKTADVVIENFAPGTVDRLGIGYDDAINLNPKIIYCSLKGFMPGPYEKRPALDEVCQMMGGLAYMTGPLGTPLRAGSSVVDILGGSMGVIGILTALYERQKTGKGTLVNATLFESVAILMAQHMAIAAITGKEPPPMPMRGRAWSIYDLFDVSGEQIFLGITSDRHWKRFCEVFGFDDLLSDARLETNQSRIEQRDWLLSSIADRLSTMDKSTVMELAERASIPFAPVSKPAELFEDPQMNQSGSLMETQLAPDVIAKMPKLPIRLKGHEFSLRNSAPALGEGSRHILNDIGLTDSEIEKLQSENVFGSVK